MRRAAVPHPSARERTVRLPRDRAEPNDPATATSSDDADPDAGLRAWLRDIVDEHTRECLGGLVDRNITSDDLTSEFDRLAVHRGYPAVLRCDNGPELACAAMAD